MTKERETSVRISATVRRSVRDKMRFLATQRTQNGRPTSESRLWSEAGALYLRMQADLPGSRENVSKKITDQIQKQAADLQSLQANIAELTAETLAQRKFLLNLRSALQPILDRLAPPSKRGG
ncbi:MAG: hypothetical protein ACYDBJ_06165 [Aggregatilineales bacterium]